MILPNRANLLANIDAEVASTCSKTTAEIDDMCSLLRLRCEALITMLPQGVRKMTVGELIDYYDGCVAVYQEKQIAEDIARKKR